MGQFGALNKKNWILFKRGLCGNCLQIIVPILFSLLIINLRLIIKVNNYDQQSFLPNSTYTKDYYGTKQAAQDAGISLYLKAIPSGQNQVIGLAPSTLPIVSDLYNILTAEGYTVVLYNADSEISAKVKDKQYGRSIPIFAFAVSFDEATLGGKYTYRLRFNISSLIDYSDGPSTTGSLIIDEAIDLNGYQKTLKSGMIGITTLLNSLILKTETGTSTNVIWNKQGPIYQQAYTMDQIYTKGNSNISLMFLLPLLIMFLRQTSAMLSQKQKKIRQNMSIMGMGMLSYHLSWFLRYFFTYFVVHLLASSFINQALPNVPIYIPLVTFLLFDMVLIVQSFFIQVFFTKAKNGVIFALLFFLVQFLLSFIITNSDNPIESANIAASIIPHIALIQACSTMLYAQSVKVPLTIIQSLNLYSIYIAWISFILNIAFWMIFQWYLQQVFPNQFGAKKHPLFCCINKNNHQNKSSENQIQKDSQLIMISKEQSKKYNYFQKVNDQKFIEMQKNDELIKVSNLKKQFEDNFIAVDNLNMEMYKNQIFVLLGHNGAGKTTTISMLTGMIEPTSGSISIMGKSQLQQIRQMIGICTQHDTLYDDLTVQQHLQLWGSFKGLEDQQLTIQVDQLIKDVNLFEKKHQFSKTLSGGQKRRLSVALAFAGKSKVIILDQPTSGMDTSARRYIWELLKKYKKNRIVLLTTHFMDEADYLGDRIGIMVQGKLACCGSASYLKNKIGIGYNLTFVKQDDKVNTQIIIQIVRKHIPNSKLLSNVSSQLSMQLPIQNIKQFSALFNQIENQKLKLKIKTYGISITTLEQVFLKVGDEKQSRFTQKKKLYQINNPQRTILPESESMQKLQNQIQLKLIENNEKQSKAKRVHQSQKFRLHLWAIILKRLRIIKRDYKSFIFQLLLPMAIIIGALLLSTISFAQDLPSQIINVNTYNPDQSPLKINIGSSDNTLLSQINTQITSKYSNDILLSSDSIDNTDFLFDKSYLYPAKKKSNFMIGGIFFQPSTIVSANTIYPFTTIVNTRILTSALFLQTLAAQTYINHIKNSNISITMINSPLPRTYNEEQIGNSASGFLAVIVFAIALSFKFSSIISFIVKQRQDRCKHQQIVSGMKITSYWFGNFIYDYLLYFVLAVFTVLMCLALNVTAFIGEAYLSVWILFLIYGLAYIPFTYIMSFIFKDYGNAQAVFYFITFVISGLLSTIVLALRLVGGNIALAANIISYILRIIPCYSFGQALLNLGSINLLSLQELPSTLNYSPLDMKITLGPIIYIIVEIFVYTLILFLIEHLQNTDILSKFFSSQSKILDSQEIQDQDVLQQQEKALRANSADYQIVTKQLRKVYPLEGAKKYKVAVDSISFAVKKGQVFGLLGVNGAGKTTTFKMLSGQVIPTAGDSYLHGLKISQNISLIRQNLGYCPQFDALIQNLTVREQLQMIYDFKSLSYLEKDKVIEDMIEQMNLKQYEDKLSGTLSGGNKRKLSVAIAILGNPDIIFLDQPSTGMDPKARRFMWKIIKKISTEQKNSTIILTTHSMEQAEALSSRLGIMISGNFRCIGTPQHIKKKFGEGYEIEIKLVGCLNQDIRNYMIKLNLQSRKVLNYKELDQILDIMKVTKEDRQELFYEMRNYIQSQFQINKEIQLYPIVQFVLLLDKSKRIKNWMKNIGEGIVIQQFQSFIRFKVKDNIKVGTLFQLLETNKQDLHIQYYSIKQATVQQIFNKFALEEGELSQMMA